jgi:cytidylate kinase
MVDELDEESAEIRDLYAEAGVALYLAQVLEHGIVNILVLADMLSLKEKARTERVKPTKEKIAEYVAMAEDAEERHYKRTMGNLLEKLYELKIEFPDGLEALLNQGLEARNRIAHRFFRERALEIANHEGRLVAIAELKEMQDVFNKADAPLDKIFRQIAIKLGLPIEHFAEYERMYTEAARAGGITEKELQNQLGNLCTGG